MSRIRKPVTPRTPRCVCIGASAAAPSCPLKRASESVRCRTDRCSAPTCRTCGRRLRAASRSCSGCRRTSSVEIWPSVRQAAALVSAGSGSTSVRAALRRPRMAVRRALADVEDRPARHVVVDDAVRQAVERVALPHELAADRVDLRPRHPVGRRLLLDADQLGREHQRREIDDRHVGGDAVVVGGIPLRDGQRFAPALRRADVVVEPRPFAVYTRSISTIAASCVFFICT